MQDKSEALMPDTHAALPPSAGRYWRYCSGWVKQGYFARQKEEKESSREGTAAHYMFSELVARVDPEQLIGRAAPNGYVMTREMRYELQPMVSHVHALQERYPSHLMRSELRISISNVHVACWGTIDLFFFALVEKKLFIIELKYGYELIEVAQCEQLNLYSLGAVSHLQDSLSREVVEVVQVVMQPRQFHALGTIRTHTTTPAKLLPFRDEMRVAARIALSEEATLTAGAHCKNCDAAATCSALHAASYEVAAFAERPGNLELSDADLSLYLSYMDRAFMLLETRKEAMEGEAEARLMDGKRIEGRMIGAGRGSRGWDRPDSEIEILGQILGHDLTKRTVLSPNQAEKSGVPKSIVKAYQKSYPGAQKMLKQNSLELAQRIFSNE